MADALPPSQNEPTGERKRDIVTRYLRMGLSEGEAQLKAALGLGQTPNVVPVADPKLDDAPRAVMVGWHPVGGMAGKWFANKTGLGKLITEKINQYPDPTQHWGVLVGDYVHQLWMDENFDVIYTNGKVAVEEWQTFTVGHTRFNDDAIRRSGESVIAQVREAQAAYNLITNNCQTFALRLLDAIKADGAAEFPTTLNVYQTLIGPGKVVDLFQPADGSTPVAAVDGDQPVKPATDGAEHTVSNAQNVMNEHTAQVDTEDDRGEQLSRDIGGEGGQEGGTLDDGQGGAPGKTKKNGFFKRVLNFGK